MKNSQLITGADTLCPLVGRATAPSGDPHKK